MDEMPKIQITKQADEELEMMLKEINDGFMSGRVKKPQLASWIVDYFRANCLAKQLENIRAAFFDEIAHLKTVVKKLEEAKKNDGSVELDKLLSPLRSREIRKPKIGSEEAKRDPQK